MKAQERSLTKSPERRARGGARRWSMRLALAGVIMAGAGLAAAGVDGNEWHRWRGPEDTGASRATGLVESWTEADENLLWKADVAGRSTPIIMDGRVYVIHLVGDKATWKEEVVCLDESDGRILWKFAFPLFHTDVPADRVGWTSLAGDPETGNVYAHGVQGLFYCFDKRGNVKWVRSLTEEFNRISGYGGRTHTPIVDGDKVIISFLNSGLGSQGPARHRYLAMNKRTGEVIYWASPGGAPLDTTFSVPTVAVINGVRQMIAANGDGWVYGMKADTGEKIWGFQLSKRGLNSSLVVSGNRVYAMHSEDNVDNTEFGRVVCIDATGEGDVTKTHEVWRKEGFRAGYASPVLAEGRLYVLDNSGNLACLDPETGKEFWNIKTGKTSWGSPVWADGKIYVPEVDGAFHIVRAGEHSASIISTRHFKHPEIPLVDIRGCAAVANGKVFVLTRDGLYCLGKKDYKREEIEVADPPSVGEADDVPAHLQIVPGEIHLTPGERVKFQAHAYDFKGRHIGVAKGVEWAVTGLDGELKNGRFRASDDPTGQFGLVSATLNTPAGEVKAEARVRVYIELPFEEDFESFEAGKPGPSDWLGGSPVRFSIVDDGGNKVYRAQSEDARFQRSEVQMGPWTLKDYTLQVDMRAHERRRQRPDMGVLNSRYRIDLQGTLDEFRIVGWIPMPRVLKQEPMEMEPGVWYRLKSRVDHLPEGQGAVVRAKIWNRDEAEPETWIELEDPAPYTSGSPGLAAFALGEVDFDNIKITPSEPLAAAAE